MKVGFFLLKFPLSSETFVLNQITAFIDMGFEVEIVALQKGDTQNTHAAWTKYNLAARTRWLQDEPTGKVAKLRHRASQTLRGIHRKNTWQALNLKRYGAESRNDKKNKEVIAFHKKTGATIIKEDDVNFHFEFYVENFIRLREKYSKYF
ncbi:hypothetical protein AUM02_000050 [Escherichia coli]|nr:hypothetical protein [Escherichia coli]